MGIYPAVLTNNHSEQRTATKGSIEPKQKQVCFRHENIRCYLRSEKNIFIESMDEHGGIELVIRLD
jgi:hypothetical protein